MQESNDDDDYNDEDDDTLRLQWLHSFGMAIASSMQWNMTANKFNDNQLEITREEKFCVLCVYFYDGLEMKWWHLYM